jgi:hypothetical protein
MATSDYYKKFPARGPVSQMAVRLVSVVQDEAISKLEGADLLMIPKVLDAELQEVRVVIEALLDVVVTEGAESYSQATCQRARALMEKLEIR